MKTYFVFNGDADGICAAHQLYLKKPQQFEAITGVKRDIALLKKIEQVSDSSINVFDIAVEKNLPFLSRLFEQNCKILWFDHHISHELPEHGNIDYHIQTETDVNTSLIVSRFLGEPVSPWAVVGLFGDNMSKPAEAKAKNLGLNGSQTRDLKKMGELLNYNAYGSTIADLHFHPAEILERMKPYSDPQLFMQEETVIEELEKGHKADFQKIEQAEWLTPNIVRLPDEKWARRVVGDFAYQLVRDDPDKDFAVLLTMGENYQVSIRTSVKSSKNAGEFCLQFPTGGGRASAAGINALPTVLLNDFVDRFNGYFNILVKSLKIDVHKMNTAVQSLSTSVVNKDRISRLKYLILCNS